jgi:hypothetical protein
VSFAAIVISRIASLADGTLALEPAKAPAHAHAHKHPTNTFLNLMRVSALIPKKASRRPIGYGDPLDPISIRDPLTAPLPEKRPATVAIRPFGGGNTATDGAKQRKSGAWR